MAQLPISVTIITKNEEKDLPRAIRSVPWASEILVVDSGSTDRTVEIAKNLGAKVLTHPWKGYGQQKNFAQTQASQPWVLNIDADEEVSPDLTQEILSLFSGPQNARGYYLPRKTYFLGKWIMHGGWYPNYLVRLSQKDLSKWTEPNVHEQLCVEGEIHYLKSPLYHYTFENLREQVSANLRYAYEGSLELKRRGQGPSAFKLVFKPLGKFIETYFLKRGFLDGWAGFLISVNAAHSIFLKYAFLIEEKLFHEHPDH